MISKPSTIQDLPLSRRDSEGADPSETRLAWPSPFPLSTRSNQPAERPLGLYVHIPFCVRKCPYCDFVSGPLALDQRRRYLEALTREVELHPLRGSSVGTVFFGGGTPSELRPGEVEHLTGALRRSFQVDASAEWTIECNPGTVNRAKLLRFRELGFTRLSLGVQSFQDAFLKELGRVHDRADVFQSFQEARRAGFDNINLDLIFALPGQSLRQWEEDLRQAVSLAPEHLSLYNLIIEPDTEFGERLRRGTLEEADEDLAAGMYELALDTCAAHGFRQYEISNFATPGRECRHNWTYWRNQPYLGVGISAASFLHGLRWKNETNMKRFLEGIGRGVLPIGGWERLSPRAALGEEIMLRLRTREGFKLTPLSRRYGIDLTHHFKATLLRLEEDGLVMLGQDWVRLTRRGLLLANTVCLEFLEEPGQPPA